MNECVNQGITMSMNQMNEFINETNEYVNGLNK